MIGLEPVDQFAQPGKTIGLALQRFDDPVDGFRGGPNAVEAGFIQHGIPNGKALVVRSDFLSSDGWKGHPFAPQVEKFLRSFQFSAPRFGIDLGMQLGCAVHRRGVVAMVPQQRFDHIKFQVLGGLVIEMRHPSIGSRALGAPCVFRFTRHGFGSVERVPTLGLHIQRAKLRRCSPFGRDETNARLPFSETRSSGVWQIDAFGA